MSLRSENPEITSNLTINYIFTVHTCLEPDFIVILYLNEWQSRLCEPYQSEKYQAVSFNFSVVSYTYLSQ